MNSFPGRFIAVSFFIVALLFGFELHCKGAAEASPTPAPVAALFNYSIGYLAADPVRSRVYATAPHDNSVIVIDTTSLTVVKTIAIGSAPEGLAISADGTKLWVANSGSTTFGIGVVDLNTLTTLPSLPT